MIINTKVINSFLEAVSPLLPEKFGTYDDADTFPNLNEMLYNLRGLDTSAEIRFGVSKMVIIADSLGDEVIKIPFNGMFNFDTKYGYDECEDEYYAGPYCWQDFEGAPSDMDESDYCLAEYEIYRQLKEEKLQCFVAKTFLYTILPNNFRVFIQEKVIPIDDSESSSLEELTPISIQTLQEAQDYRSKKNFRATADWIARCIIRYGIKQTERFMNYCCYTNYNINADMHFGNYGYRSNGTPCILDYSNFSM